MKIAPLVALLLLVTTPSDLLAESPEKLAAAAAMGDLEAMFELGIEESQRSG